MKKQVYIAFLFVYMLAFNLLVLNAVSKQGILNNVITGNVVSLSASPTSDPKFILPLFLFNLAIIGFFTLSYTSLNKHRNIKTRTRYHKA